MLTTANMNYDVFIVDGDHATICWRGWQRPDGHGGLRECGEILIRSSFGSWGNAWGHCGVPFERFLLKADRGYMAEKLLNERAFEFDGQKSVVRLRQRIVEWRKAGEFNKEEARQAWDFVDERSGELELNEQSLVDALYRAPDGTAHLRAFFCEPWNAIQTSINRQFAGFWRVIWPEFCKVLSKHTTP